MRETTYHVTAMLDNGYTAFTREHTKMDLAFGSASDISKDPDVTAVTIVSRYGGGFRHIALYEDGAAKWVARDVVRTVAEQVNARAEESQS